MARPKKAKASEQKPKRTTRRPEQQELPDPGFKRKVAPEIESLERELTEARTAKSDAKADEDEAAAKLAEAMRKHSIDVYKFTDAEGLEVTIRVKPTKTKITVKRKKPAAADEAEAN